MNRRQLAHVLRAAADVGDDPQILVVGSQAILASYQASTLPPGVTMSVEADIAFFDDPDDSKSDLVDGAIGEDSMFHQTFGYYGQGVSMSTATLPRGWEDRLVPFVPEDSHPAQALCLDPSREAGCRKTEGLRLRVGPGAARGETRALMPAIVSSR